MEVVRGGKRIEVLIFDLVVGDIVPLKIGDQVIQRYLMSLQMILISGHSLVVDESSMTGRARLYFTGHSRLNPYIKGKTSISEAVDGVIKIIIVAVMIIRMCILMLTSHIDTGFQSWLLPTVVRCAINVKCLLCYFFLVVPPLMYLVASRVKMVLVDGFNVCISSYGQIGTGKTYTIEGTLDDTRGNYRTLEELFRISEEQSDTMRHELFVSMLEVYNERICDLLVDGSNQHHKKLEIKQSAEGTQEVPGLVKASVHNTVEVLFRVTVKGENLVNGQRTMIHLWLVDLEGSEQNESQFINNKSLSALGDVISSLASKTSHIPCRNSKLTYLLQSSLGGDYKTLMFVHISPSSADSGETLCSMNFATLVRGIEHGPACKQSYLTKIFKFKQMQDKKETKKLHDSLQSLQLRFDVREQLCRSLQEKNQLTKEKQTRLQQEARDIAAYSTKPLGSLSVKALRPPLRGIATSSPWSSNLQSLPLKPCKVVATGHPTLPSVDEQENFSMSISSCNTKTLMRPRRVSIAVSPASATVQYNQPRRRISIATILPYP
ncbi:hypothetical protein MKX03_009976 [Papaver bracteatum]|nr:hypothetical protein MKX03_009976 [Papaver bracteatum]